MSISTLQQPEDYSLAKNENRMTYKLSTDNRYSTPGSSFNAGMDFLTIPDDGDILTVEINGETYDITFTTTPADCLDVDISGVISPDAVLQNLLDALQNIFQFSDWYQSYITGGQIVITALADGSIYDIDFTGTALPHMAILSSNGTDPVERDGFRIIVDIFVEESYLSGIFSKSISQSLQPDENDTVEFDIHEVMLGFLSESLPGWQQSTPAVANEIIRRYHIRSAEFYSDTYNCYLKSTTRSAFYAGVPEKDLPVSTWKSLHFDSVTARSFLTSIPRGFYYANREMPMYLYLWCKDNETYRLGVRLSYSDGSQVDHYDLMNTTTENRIIKWPAGYEALDIDSLRDPDLELISYEVFVIVGADLDTATFKSELFKIILDDEHYENNLYLLFQNSKGGMDTVWFKGNKVKLNTTDTESYNIFPPVQDVETLVKGELQTDIRTFTNALSIFSGYYSREYIDYLQDMVKTEKSYIIDMDQEKYVESMVLAGDELELYNDKTDQYGLNIKVMLTQVNRGY